MSESTNKLPKGFWAIGIIALIWNLMGVYSYLQQAYMTDEAKEGRNAFLEKRKPNFEKKWIP